MFVCLFIVVFEIRPCHGALAGLKLTEVVSVGLKVLGLKACTTIPGVYVCVCLGQKSTLGVKPSTLIF